MHSSLSAVWARKLACFPAETSNAQDTRHDSLENSSQRGGMQRCPVFSKAGSRTNQKSLLFVKASNNWNQKTLQKAKGKHLHTHTHTHAQRNLPCKIFFTYFCMQRKKINKAKQSPNKTKINNSLPSKTAFSSSPRLSWISREFGGGWEEPRVEGLYK